MLIKIKNPARMLCFDNEFFDTNRDIDVSLSVALRISRYSDVEAIYQKQKYDPSSWKDKKQIVFISDIDPYSGWGNVTQNLLSYTKDSFNNILVGRTYNVKDPYIYNILRKEIKGDTAAVWHEQPKHYWVNSPFGKNIAIVPWETTRCPASWVQRINSMDALLVPCKQNIQAFRDSGVTIPIELIHWGIDPEKFSYMERETQPVYTFASMGALSSRKGTDLLIRAFKEAFPTDKGVRLILKTSHRAFPFEVKDPRIIVMMDHMEHQDLINDFFKKIDCFVFPTRGEGFGLPPLEAMAMGYPTVVTNFAGTAEFANNEVAYMLDYKLTPATDFSNTVYREDCGEWAEPDFDQLVNTLRHIYANQDEAKEKGKKAANYVTENWLWKDKIQMYKDALEKYL